MLEVLEARSDQISQVQHLWREYWGGLGLAPDFQNFAEELRTLPGVYTPPKGQLLLATYAGEHVGTAAFRSIGDHACEAKRLYVRPSYRGVGIGKLLLQTLVKEAGRIGFGEMFADTLNSMTAAQQMYREMGFTEVPAYASVPTPDAVYLRLSLSA